MNKGVIIFIVTAITVGTFAFNGRVQAPEGQTADIAKPILLPTSGALSPTFAVRTALQSAALGRYMGLFGASQVTLRQPVDGFIERITKKDFGIYITPDTSPVEHDRFTGFHTGVDAEFTDTTADVPVYAIADGTIVLARWTSGYGGVIVIRHIINGIPLYAVYGHLDQASFPPATVTRVNAGQQIAILGDDHSHETDGVRKHIHFAIYAGEKLDIRGYVASESDLSAWLNPLDLYR